MVMNTRILVILYFCEMFTNFVDKVIDRISKISFPGFCNVPVGILKSRTHNNDDKSTVDSVKKDKERFNTFCDESCMTGNNLKCCLAITQAKTQEFKVSKWNTLYNNLRKTFFRIFRINRKL
ncbi:hypothetical protein CRE_21870 [Caenorhabditis remanei]|uniref:Uncharacterized protein n=1 Tax=Caenorhabditis remanei TaxID=31234 RepID=E3MUD7_CAERE|nr:hypothetical protein CRE_21870 [Caenorhabditis remanei]